MKRLFFCCCISVAVIFVGCADNKYTPLPLPEVSLAFALPEDINECSGAEMLHGELWVHNDSGDDPVLYNVDLITGEIEHRTHLAGVGNVDWEEAAFSTEYGYVGDYGNNKAMRTDLKIIKFPLSELHRETIDAPQEIFFKFADQIDFSGTDTLHNFDIEAMVTVGEDLHLFTKDRSHTVINVYRLTTEITDFERSLLPDATIPADGMITAADYDEATGRLALLGYHDWRFPFDPFVYIIDDYRAPNWSAERMTHYALPFSGKAEAVTWEDERTLLVGTEAGGAAGEKVYRVAF